MSEDTKSFTLVTIVVLAFIAKTLPFVIAPPGLANVFTVGYKLPI